MFIDGRTVLSHDMGITTLKLPNGGTRVIDDRTGEGFHISILGERLSIADGLDCSCGPEFTRYVRFYLDSFPYSHMGPRNRDVDNLWVDRKLNLKLQIGKANKDCFDFVASVVSWEEWNMGPYSDHTDWAVIVRIERNGSNALNIGDLVKYKESMATIASINGKSIEIKFNDQMIFVEKDSLKVIEQLRFYIRRMDVHGGGSLSISDKFVSNDDIAAFEWIDPPNPYRDEELQCFHGIEDLAERGVDTQEFLRFLMTYLQQHAADNVKGNPMSTPEHITGTVIDFFEKQPELISEDFCKFVWIIITETYLDMSNNSVDKKEALLGFLILATNLKYRYLPEKNGEKVDVNKISKLMRDIFSDRGMARVLGKELTCGCANKLKQISEKMEKHGTCFGCCNQEQKSALLECSRCRFARVSDWDNHKKVCKAIRKQTKM